MSGPVLGAPGLETADECGSSFSIFKIFRVFGFRVSGFMVLGFRVSVLSCIWEFHKASGPNKDSKQLSSRPPYTQGPQHEILSSLSRWC